MLDDGRIEERGRHDALRALGGLYAQMWARQAEMDGADEMAEEPAREPAE